MSEAPDEVSLSEALLAWVRTFPEVVVTKLEDLQDGQVLWHLLHEIDPAYFDDGEIWDHSEDVDSKRRNRKMTSISVLDLLLNICSSHTHEKAVHIPRRGV